MQELYEPSINMALSRASQVTESSQETTPPVEDKSESPDVTTIHSDRCTPFMIYLRTWACMMIKMNVSDYND
jgi:hypothetical protein